MEIIDPVKNHEINMPNQGPILKNLNVNQNQEIPQKPQAGPPAVVVISHIVQAMNNYLNTMGSEIKIKVYKVNDQIIVKAISKERGTIIKTIKPEKLLSLNSAIRNMVGLLIDGKA